MLNHGGTEGAGAGTCSLPSLRCAPHHPPTPLDSMGGEFSCQAAACTPILLAAPVSAQGNPFSASSPEPAT